MDTGMPRWRNGRARTPAPIVHLSADRLGDMVDAVRSNPPDLATLPRTQAAFLESPPVEFSPPPSPRADEAPPAPAVEPPAVEPRAVEPRAVEPPAVELPVEFAPDYTWDDALPPAVLPAEDIAVVAPEVPLPELEIPGAPEPAPASRVAKKKKGGRHRRRPSLSHFGRGLARTLRSALVTPRVVALVGIIGLLVVATALLGAS
jgi:hypothetical protein